MVTYQDGTEIQVGDQVLIEHSKTPGVVTEVVESESSQLEWNVEEPGVMLEAPPFGLVFWPVSSFAADPPVFVSRGE